MGEYTDGLIAHGTYTVLIHERNTNYILDVFSVNEPVRATLERLNTTGGVIAQKHIPDAFTFDGEISIDRTTTAIPRSNDTFNVVDDGYQLLTVGQARGSEQKTTVPVTGKRTVTPLIIEPRVQQNLTVSAAMTTVSTVAVNKGTGPTYAATTLPTNVSINSSTGDITGTPNVTGTYNSVIEITHGDDSNKVGIRKVTWVVS